MDTLAYVHVPYVTIHPNSINLYKRVEWQEKKKFRPKFKHLLESDKRHYGRVSQVAHRKISKAVDYLLIMANDKKAYNTTNGQAFKFKISFITLTLPTNQFHSDNIIKSACLNQFLIEASKKWHIKNYIWRAEKQKNGSIHFHILTDKFIPWSELRDVWNRIVNKLGYVEKYRDHMRAFHSEGFQVRSDLLKNWDYKAQVKAYQKGKVNDWSSPNSTDVHSIGKINNIRKYILKYTVKDDNNGEILGRMWGCSESLSKIEGATEVFDSYFQEEIKKLINEFSERVYCSDYFTVIHVSIAELYKCGYLALFKLFSAFMYRKFNFSIQLENIG